jgi:MFS family permease
MTRDTVLRLTPATVATSRIVDRRFGGSALGAGEGANDFKAGDEFCVQAASNLTGARASLALPRGNGRVGGATYLIRCANQYDWMPVERGAIRRSLEPGSLDLPRLASEVARSRRRGAGVVGLAFVAMLASSPGQSYWLALFIDGMLEGTGLSRASFAALYAAATVCSALVALNIGSLFDRRGAASTWVVAAFGVAAGCAVMSVATGAVTALIGLALLRAFGQGAFTLVGTLMVTRTFGVWRGRALSLAYLGNTLAAALLPPLAAVMIAAVGWREGLRLTGVVALLVIAPAAGIVALTLGRAGRRPGAPLLWRQRYRPARVAAAASARARRFPWRGGGGVLLVAMTAVPLVYTSLVFHAAALVARGGLGLPSTAAVLSVMAVASAVGSVAGGAIVDRLGVRASVLAMNLLLALGAGVLIVPTGPAAFAGFGVVGVAYGVSNTGSGAAWAHTYGRTDLGELQGLGSAARTGTSALGPLVLAAGLALTGGYAAGLGAMVVAALASTVLALRLHDR